MLKAKTPRSFRTLVMLACTLSIMAVAFDGRITPVKAQTHPVCATLGLTAALLSGTVDYCGASGFPELVQLDSQIRFERLTLASLMIDRSITLIGQDLETQLLQDGDDYLVRLAVNE
jgi:hypothetical protein